MKRSLIVMTLIVTAVAGFNGAAQLVRHGLLAIADAKDRDACIEQRLRRAR